MKAKTYYINEDANGFVFVSEKPMNQSFYSTPARIKCISTKAKRTTKKGIFAGAICMDTDGNILKIIKVKNRQGYERKYIKEGNLNK